MKSLNELIEELDTWKERGLLFAEFKWKLANSWSKISAKLKEYEDWEGRWSQRCERLQREADLLRKALQDGPQLLRSLAGTYIKAEKYSDHDCALELSSALHHWVVKEALDQADKIRRDKE